MGMPQPRESNGRFGRRAGDDTFFEITNKDIYDEVKSLRGEVAGIDRRVSGLESRIRGFHKKVALAVPATTVLASVATIYYSLR